MAEWLGEGLQNLLRRFDSVWYLRKINANALNIRSLAFFIGGIFEHFLNFCQQNVNILNKNLVFRLIFLLFFDFYKSFVSLRHSPKVVYF